MNQSNQPDPHRNLAFLRSEYNRLVRHQQDLDQQRLDWELQRLEIDLQILQDEQLRQQQEYDCQLQADLEADRRADLDRQRAELQTQREELQQLREQIRAEREMMREQSQQPGQEAAAQVEAEINTADRVYSPDSYNEQQLSAWEIYCLGMMEKPDRVHTRQWDDAVFKATGERPTPQIDNHQQWYEFRESLQAIASETEPPSHTQDNDLGL